MKNSTLLMLTFIGVLGGLVLLVLNLIPADTTPMIGGYIKPGDVRGAAVEHGGLLYTLNFEQQNTLLRLLNRSVPVSKTESESLSPPPPISKILLYLFQNRPV